MHLQKHQNILGEVKLGQVTHFDDFIKTNGLVTQKDHRLKIETLIKSTIREYFVQYDRFPNDFLF